MDEYLLKIGEVAAFFGVSVKTLRVYEKIGILKPVKIDESSGYRYYSAEQIRSLDAVLELRGLGFSLVEIKTLLESGPTRDAYMEALVHKKAEWRERLSQARDRIETIDEAIEKLKSSKPHVKLHGLTDEERAGLLSRFACLKIDLRERHASSILSEALWL